MAFYFTLILLSWVDSLILLPLSSTEPITYKWCHLVFGVHVRHQRGQHSQLTLSADWTNFIKAHICVYIRTVSVCRCSQHLADCRWILCNFFSFCQVLKLWRHPPENSETNRNVKETRCLNMRAAERRKTNNQHLLLCLQWTWFLFFFTVSSVHQNRVQQKTTPLSLPLAACLRNRELCMDLHSGDRQKLRANQQNSL